MKAKQHTSAITVIIRQNIKELLADINMLVTNVVKVFQSSGIQGSTLSQNMKVMDINVGIANIKPKLKHILNFIRKLYTKV